MSNIKINSDDWYLELNSEEGCWINCGDIIVFVLRTLDKINVSLHVTGFEDHEEKSISLTYEEVRELLESRAGRGVRK